MGMFTSERNTSENLTYPQILLLLVLLFYIYIKMELKWEQ